MNFDYLEEAQDQRNGLIQYDPTVPLPAFYDPPDEREELFYPPRNPSHPRLYPLLTIQTHSPSEYQSLEPNQIFTVHEIPKNEVVRDEKSCCDVRALKIGACIVLIFVVAVGTFVGYIVGYPSIIHTNNVLSRLGWVPNISNQQLVSLVVGYTTVGL